MARILVVDDEIKIRRQIAMLLSEEGHTVDQAERVGQALEMLRQTMYELIISDVRLPDQSGIELLREALAIQPGVAVVVITAYGSVEDAVQAMRLGAFDYIQKPFRLEALALVCRHALSDATLKAEHQYMLDETRAARGGPVLIGSSVAMERVRELIATAAAQPSTVLLSGESGTGKELVAEAIHNRSGKEDRPLVRVNCPAIPRELFESELFGHIKGAFTGAYQSRRGKFELADGGTLFLDEISEIPLALQSKLLRVLEGRRFNRVGGTNEIQVDLKVIAASNRDLKRAVEEGRFREDLYFRLDVFPIHIPPLRERLEDIPELVDHLLDRLATQFHMSCPGISTEAVQHLQAYSWPGNVRELCNVLERGLLLARGSLLDLEHLPAELAAEIQPGDPALDNLPGLNQQMEQHRKQLILEALERCRWVKKDAARVLGLSPRALSHYIAKYDLDSMRRQ